VRRLRRVRPPQCLRREIIRMDPSVLRFGRRLRCSVRMVLVEPLTSWRLSATTTPNAMPASTRSGVMPRRGETVASLFASHGEREHRAPHHRRSPLDVSRLHRTEVVLPAWRLPCSRAISARRGPEMRIKIVQAPTFAEVDGIDLSAFTVGTYHTVGTRLGAFMIAEGWAVFGEDVREPRAAAADRSYSARERRGATPERSDTAPLVRNARK